MTAGATSERVKRSYVTDTIAECRGCSWTSSAPNAVGTSAQHHDRTGHVVAVSITRLVIFGDPDTPPPGQATLPL
jgi:hypothetical protein